VTKPKLLVTRILSPAVIERARRDYDLDLDEDDHIMSADELVARCQGKDAALVTLTEKFTPEVIGRLPPSLRVIATYSVGFEHIDLAAAKARGIRVANTPDAVTIATAEIAMLLILGSARRAPEGERLLKDKKWGGWQPMQLIGRRLDGKRLGIMGLGKIGQAIAKRASAFDMEIHYYNRRRRSAEQEAGAIYHDTLDSLLAVSDVLSISAPSTPETRGSINAAACTKASRISTPAIMSWKMFSCCRIWAHPSLKRATRWVSPRSTILTPRSPAGSRLPLSFSDFQQSE
jgi:lactate dehydrogenase-like 2-hydroxyacid dehydrogenase